MQILRLSKETPKPCRYKDSCIFLKAQSCEYLHKEYIKCDNCESDLAAKNKELENKIGLLENSIKAKDDIIKETKDNNIHVNEPLSKEREKIK